MQETWVWSLGWEDPLEKGTATHSGILAGRIPWTEAWQATVHGVAKSWTWLSNFHFHPLLSIYLSFPIYLPIRPSIHPSLQQRIAANKSKAHRLKTPRKVYCSWNKIHLQCGPGPPGALATPPPSCPPFYYHQPSWAPFSSSSSPNENLSVSGS